MVVIFTALGLGLALPYLAVAARPGLVRALPKPGRWMLRSALLGVLLALTAAWLFWVLAAVAGTPAAALVAAALALAAALIWLRQRAPRGALTAAVALLGLAFAAPALVERPGPAPSARRPRSRGCPSTAPTLPAAWPRARPCSSTSPPTGA